MFGTGTWSTSSRKWIITALGMPPVADGSRMSTSCDTFRRIHVDDGDGLTPLLRDQPAA